jgi:hypothetical protein
MVHFTHLDDDKTFPNRAVKSAKEAPWKFHFEYNQTAISVDSQSSY